jgi:GNAT superfamily N-acetyltransferase
MTDLSPRFRPLRRTELDIVLDWAAAEGWNPGLHDADAFWAADPEGFIGMEIDDQLVGSASIVSYGAKLGFVGLFIVCPEWRRRGLGTEFWNFFIKRLVERLEAGAPASLDGVFDMQAYYARSGFTFSHRNLRMEGVGKASEISTVLVELSTLPFRDVLQYDQAHFGMERAEFLKHWINPPGGYGLTIPLEGGIAGYGVIRPCRKGFKIGPLFANDLDTAELLFAGLADHAAGSPIFLDVPENNPKALELAAKHGLKECFGCARMSTGLLPAIPWHNVYGVTTFELG